MIVTKLTSSPGIKYVSIHFHIVYNNNTDNEKVFNYKLLKCNITYKKLLKYNFLKYV